MPWKSGFGSNGERIFYTATSDRGGVIKLHGIINDDGKEIAGPIACVSCHSPDGKGGKQVVNVGEGKMQVMDAKDIRWSVLKVNTTQNHSEMLSEVVSTQMDRH